jgi:hypothetical protein
MRTDGLDYNDNVREFKRAFMLAKNTGSGHAVVDAFLKAPMAVAQAAMWPAMKLLVPNMKRGVFAMEMRRMIENNPGMSEAEMRKAAQTAAANTENRLGQVTYQNLHQNNTVKAAMQLALRAYGWQATKYRMAFDAAGDWAKAGKALARGEKPELTYGMTYLPALVMTHAVIAASIQAALTGEWPEELKDYLFPKSGLKDRYGQDVRLSMADFLKDYVADFRSFPDPRKMTTEWTRKLSPMWNMAAEMYNDKDFYGDEIFSAKEIDEPYAAHLRKNLGEASHYLLTKSEPFSVRGGAKMRDEYGAGPVLSLAPYVGLVPAPSYATKTPAQIKASEVMQSQRPQGARTAPEKQRADELAAVQKVMREAIRTGAISTAGQEELAKNIGAVKTHAQMATIMQKLNVSPLQYQIMHMQRSRDAMMVWDLADAKEKKEIYPLVLRKVYQGMRNDPEAGQRYLKILQNTAPGTTPAK